MLQKPPLQWRCVHALPASGVMVTDCIYFGRGGRGCPEKYFALPLSPFFFSFLLTSKLKKQFETVCSFAPNLYLVPSIARTLYRSLHLLLAPLSPSISLAPSTASSRQTARCDTLCHCLFFLSLSLRCRFPLRILRFLVEVHQGSTRWPRWRSWVLLYLSQRAFFLPLICTSPGFCLFGGCRVV